MEKNKNDISRQEFNNLKDKVSKMEGMFDKITSIALSVERLATEIKYMKEE